MTNSTTEKAEIKAETVRLNKNRGKDWEYEYGKLFRENGAFAEKSKALDDRGIDLIVFYQHYLFLIQIKSSKTKVYDVKAMKNDMQNKFYFRYPYTKLEINIVPVVIIRTAVYFSGRCEVKNSKKEAVKVLLDFANGIVQKQLGEF